MGTKRRSPEYLHGKGMTRNRPLPCQKGRWCAGPNRRARHCPSIPQLEHVLLSGQRDTRTHKPGQVHMSSLLLGDGRTRPSRGVASDTEWRGIWRASASNGAEALECVKQRVPDLVIRTG
jgi:hypothetical protein